MIKQFKCYGGPLDGHVVTQQYAGTNYIQYNSSVGEDYPRIIVNNKWPINGKSKRGKQLKIKPYVEKAILLFCPRPENILVSVDVPNV